MRVALVGAELEENLALRYLHAAVTKAAHQAEIFDFHSSDQTADLVSDLLAWTPDVIGFSMVFTARGREFVDLAQALRSAGFRGHLTGGGHFAAFHAAQILRDFPAFDSIVHGEGEETLVDLIAHLDDPAGVQGISYRTASGEVRRTPARRNPDDLDTRSWPTRPRVFHQYLGRPIANMLAGRGCFGNCHFCSINAWYRENPGRRFRQRAAECVGDEIAALYHEHGVRIFNFHDDNFFLPDARRNVERFGAIRRDLETLGVGRIAVQVKARPDSVEPDVMAALMDLGLFRVFLGVESNAVAGLKALGRGIRREQNHRALRLLLDLGVHVTFNLLMFEPDATVADLRDNVDFIRQYPDVPLNFGRVEVFTGTALEQRLRAEGRLCGDYFGYTYTLADKAAEAAYELYREVFLPRNFSDTALNLKAMRLDYYFHLLKHFHPDRAGSVERRVQRLIRRLNEHSVRLLDQILDHAETGSKSAVETERLARRLADARAQFDRDMATRMDETVERIRALARAEKGVRRGRLAAASVAASVAAALVLATEGCGPPEATEMMPPPQEQPKPPVDETKRPMSPEETAAVQKRVTEAYGDQFGALAEKHMIRRLNVTLSLSITARGEVKASEVRLPEDWKKRGLGNEIADQVKGWTFPNVKRAGTCEVGVTLRGDWEICEYMETPHRP